MRTLLIDYDLRSPGRDYSSLIAALQTFPFCHTLRSSWFVKSAFTPLQMAQFLRPHIDANDGLIVLDITGQRNAAWYALDPRVAQWINANL